MLHNIKHGSNDIKSLVKVLMDFCKFMRFKYLQIIYFFIFVNMSGNIVKTMFNVEYCKATTDQDWLVRQFEAFHFDQPFLTEKFIPRPDVSIIFHFKDTPLILNEKKIQLEPFFAAPIIPKSLLLNFHGLMDTFVVICKPTVFSRIFGIDLSPMPRHSITLPHSIFYPAWDALSALKTTSERIDYFIRFINKVQNTPYIPDAVDQLYDKILEKGTTTLLKDIMQDCCACKRTLERNFIKRTGVSPKTVMRIIRLDYLWSKIIDEGAIDYQELVFDGNYFDQAHFINDFKNIVGETPSFFFKRNLQLTKMFSGREITNM